MFMYMDPSSVKDQERVEREIHNAKPFFYSIIGYGVDVWYIAAKENGRSVTHESGLT
jgi:hypothetical protein